MADYKAIKESIASKQPIPKNVIQTQNIDKKESKYTTRVRQAISDEYVRCSAERAKVAAEIISISKQLTLERDHYHILHILTYKLKYST